MMRTVIQAVAMVVATSGIVASESVTEGQEREFLRFNTSPPNPQAAADPQHSEKGCLIPQQPRLLNPNDAPANAAPDQASSVLLSIYRRQNAERIVAQEKCTCDDYFAPWDNALDEMDAVYLGLDFNKWAEFRRENRQTTNALSPQVREICTESGVL